MKYFQGAIIVVSIFFIGFTLTDPPKHGTENTDVISCTELNGLGCVCHTIDQDSTVFTRVEGPSSLRPGETALYRVFVSGGPALGGGYNVASRFGTLGAGDSSSRLLDNELTQMYPKAFPAGATSISWDFYYTAPVNKTQDTIYSVGLSTNHDYIPNEFDLWAFGPKFVVNISRNATSVEEESTLSSFRLEGNYPNPFNPSTKISFFLPVAGEVNLMVYNSAGEIVWETKNVSFGSGKQSIEFRSDGLPSGIYLYKIDTKSGHSTGKMLLLK